MDVADGLVAVVKHDCPTCELVQPVLSELGEAQSLSVPGFSVESIMGVRRPT
jgi:hypothetical protein